MSVGDSEAPPGRPPVTEQAKSPKGPDSVVAARSIRVPAASPPPDGPVATAMDALDLVDEVGQQNRKSGSVITIQSPRTSSSRGGENDESSGQETALAIIVNDALATASASVASKKRHQSFAGHEHSVVMDRVADALAQKRGSRFDRDRFVLWRPEDRRGVAVRITASEAAGSGHAGSITTTGRSSGGETLEPEPQPPVERARRFTAHVLPSIPEHRVLGRRVLVRETPGGGGKGGDEASWNEGPRNKVDDRGVQRNELREEADIKLLAEGGGEHTTPKPEPSLVLPQRKGEVLDVPHGLFGEASSTGVDPSHPPSAAVDGVLASFWLSTGLFPQTLTIRLQRPVAVYEVMVACGGVNAARVHLGHINSGVRDSSSGDGGGFGRDARAWRGDRRKEGSLLELVGEQQRPFVTGGGSASAALSNSYSSRGGAGRKTESSLALAKMTFRVPGEGRLADKVDRLSLIVTSARAPFCLVTSVIIRGQFGSDDDEEEGDE
eukprot:g8321.t1